jgi:hypothetical protein
MCEIGLHSAPLENQSIDNLRTHSPRDHLRRDFILPGVAGSSATCLAGLQSPHRTPGSTAPTPEHASAILDRRGSDRPMAATVATTALHAWCEANTAQVVIG